MFKKGHKKIGGRVAGTPNKFARIKEDMFEVFYKIGGIERLMKYAAKNDYNYQKFVHFIVTLMPKEYKADIELNLKSLVEDVRRSKNRNSQFLEN